jgi:hypothetical protein
VVKRKAVSLGFVPHFFNFQLKFLITDADKDFKAAGNFRTGKEGWMKSGFKVKN